MSLNETSSIRFSVEESVWFKKGQEVANLVSMSLDPEISVQEIEDYISIRGALVLTGEYYPSETPSEQDDNSLRESSNVRTIDEVVETEDGVNNINHRFPVDITIPANRIKSLDDVYVLVESFDYEIPNQGQLQLTADLSISGIVNERETVNQIEANEVNAEIDSEPEDSDWEEPLHTASSHQSLARETNEVDEPQEEQQQETPAEKFPTFYSEARKEPVQETQESTVSRIEDYKVESAPEPSSSGLEEEETHLQVVASREEEEEETQEEQPQEEVVAEEREEQVEETDDVEEEPPSHTPQTPQIEMKGRTEDEGFGWNPKSMYQNNSDNVTEKPSETDADEEQAESRSRTRSENALYLTKMLASGEEDFSKLRMRIVQTGETLGTIAENYDISPNQIIRMNGLDDDVVEEGQILYIPAYAGVE